MAQNDPFTLSLFGDTALGSSLGIGLGEFSGSAANDPGDDNPDPTIPPSAPALPTPTPARRTAALPEQRKRGSNFHIEVGRGLGKGWKERARHNIEAIRLAAKIDEVQRPATLEE